MTLYNAAPFVRAALDSLLAQDYPNFEIVISDNASTDGSSEIAQEYAARDPRIRYSRNETNIGAVRNWNRALELSSGPYALWASDHDLFHPTYISRAVEILESDPSVVLAYSQAKVVTHSGQIVESVGPQLDTRGMSLRDRFHKVIYGLRRCTEVHAVMRRDPVVALGGFPNCWSMDFPLLGAMSLYGAFAQIPDELFSIMINRVEVAQGSGKEAHGFHAAQLDPSRSSERQNQSRQDLLRETRNVQIGYVMKSPHSWWTRIRLAEDTLKCYWRRYGIGFLGLEKLRHLMPKSLRRNSTPSRSSPRNVTTDAVAR